MPPVPAPPAPSRDKCAALNSGARPLLLPDRVDHIRKRHGEGGPDSTRNNFRKHWDDEDWIDYLGRILSSGRQDSIWTWNGESCNKVVRTPDGTGWVRIAADPGPPAMVNKMFPVASRAR